MATVSVLMGMIVAFKTLWPRGQERIQPSQFVTTARRCPHPVRVPDDAFKSQDNEDRKLMDWFGNFCHGTYIEMGALDGVEHSNSHAFNKGGLMWKGVMIELMKHNFKNLVLNRPNEIALINAGVCDKPQKLHYYNGLLDSVGGIYEFTTPHFRERYWGDNITMDSPGIEEIKCDTLDSLLLKYSPETTFFDFFSLDVEGAELSVLRSIDFDRVGFGIIFLEVSAFIQSNEFQNLVVKQLLQSKGYVFLESWGRSYWFVHPLFHEIYGHLIY